jgi:ATP-dependent helicase YprA (DUF1998 family)
MMTLHEHQKKAIELFERSKRRKVIIQECTGLGKTEREAWRICKILFAQYPQ